MCDGICVKNANYQKRIVQEIDDIHFRLVITRKTCYINIDMLMIETYISIFPFPTGLFGHCCPFRPRLPFVVISYS